VKPVTCFGEMLLRLSPPGSELFFQSPSLRTWFGGSEMNVAVGLAHLGTPSRYVTKLPENAVGDAALSFLRAEDVDARQVRRGGARMGIYFVESGADLRPMRVVYDRAGSAFSAIEPSELDWSDILRDAGGLHLSGITPAVGDGPARVALAAAEAARTLGVPVSLDLNYRPALWGSRDPRPVMAQLAAASGLLIGNPGAFRAMLGVDTSDGDDDASVAAACRRVHEELGCGRVAVTRRDARSASEHGWHAYLYHAATATLHTSRAYTVRVVDRVGGGDSFAAGLLHAFGEGRDDAAALEFATAVSAIKLTIPGDVSRTTAAEADRLLAARAEMGVKG